MIRTAVLLILVALTSSVSFAEEGDPRQLAQLIEYISVDYPEAVQNGAVVNQDEYQEMLEFSGVVINELQRLEPSGQTDEFLALANRLSGFIHEKDSVERIRETAADLRRRLLQAYPVLSLPKEFLPPQQLQTLYSESCGGCHGEAGQGDGAFAQGLSPAPTDFTDRARAVERSVMGLYETISGGVEGTAMTGFSNLSETERWSLAFYVGSLAFDGEQAEAEISPAAESVSLQDLVLYSPKALKQSHPSLTYADIATLRADPTALAVSLAASSEDPIAFARRQLVESRSEYLSGNYASAHQLAVSAYLDGFELVENALSAHDPQLMRSIESDMIALRQLLMRAGNEDQVAEVIRGIDSALLTAGKLLGSNTLEGTTVFITSFLILLREGLEALLVVLALATVLIKSDRRDALKYMHAGWILAVIAGGLTWIASQHLLVITGASREITEGIAALLAAVVLFYVGFWMHRKTRIDQWQGFIADSIHRQLGQGALLGISGLAFIAVYRELFETVLFYQALWTQIHSSQANILIAGLLGGLIVLAVLGWLIIKYSIRLPLKRFFSITVYVLLALSFVLMGKAVIALQEAGLISITPFPLPLSFEWFGVYPTWEGIGSQAAILLLSLAMIFFPNATGSNRKSIST